MKKDKGEGLIINEEDTFPRREQPQWQQEGKRRHGRRSPSVYFGFFYKWDWKW